MRVAEAGEARVCTARLGLGLPGQAQSTGTHLTLGTPGPLLGVGARGRGGGESSASPPPHPGPGLHVLFISLELFSPACESEAINFMAGFNFSL